MNQLIVRGFVQRKVRAILTGIAIALGVALMAGTYILTDTINHAFAEVFASAYANKAVVVTEKETLGRHAGAERSILTPTTVAHVRGVSGVEAAEGSVSTRGALLTTAGTRLTSGGSPGLVDGLQPPRFESFKAAEGTLPRAPDQVAIDQATAQREHLRVGQQIVIAGRSPARTYTISGISRFAGAESFGGASVALVTIAQSQYIAGEPGLYDGINVAATPGVSPETLASRVRAALPDTLVVRTGAQEAANQTQELEEDLGFLRTFLLIFAYVAIVVGAFIIFNTFSITVAQRTREFGLLRTLGASRGQIMRSVVVEGLLLGVLGSVAGLAIGVGLAPALNGLFKALGADLPDNGMVLEARTVTIALLVGTAVTVAAGFFPALRATRVPPIAAMREGVPIPPRPIPSRRALIIRFVIAIAVVVALSSISRSLGVVLLVAVVVRGLRLVYRLRHSGQQRRYRIIPALGRFIGLSVSWRGITGRLARENSVRQPGRTLVTALALTIGLGLVAFISVLAAGTKATINEAVNRSFTGNLIITNKTEGQGVPAVVGPAVRRIHGVGELTAVAFPKGRVRDLSKPGAPVIDEKSPMSATEPESFGRMYKVQWEHGSAATLASLGQEGTVLKKAFASAHHLEVGQRLLVETPTGREVHLTIRGILKEEVIGLLRNLTISRALAYAAFGVREDGVNFISYAPGADAHEVRTNIDALLRTSFPQVQSQTGPEYTKEVSNGVNKLLLLVYVLLALSVLVSLFGIVNTLILSIYERTRELGMMRAIGTSRRQIRQMIRYESVITGLIGGVLGLVIGVVGAILVTELLLKSSGYVLSIPVVTLILLLVASAIAGLIAAQLPARRAARIDVLTAISGE